MNKDLFIKMVSKIDQTCEDEFKAEYNSPELIWEKIICKLTAQSPVIPTRFEDWKIERVDRYWYASGRNYNTYVETTYWYEAHTMQRKETSRQETEVCGCNYRLPEWAKGITEQRRSLSSF